MEGDSLSQGQIGALGALMFGDSRSGADKVVEAFEEMGLKASEARELNDSLGDMLRKAEQPADPYKTLITGRAWRREEARARARREKRARKAQSE